MRIPANSGSLGQASSNSRLIEALTRLAPDGVSVAVPLRGVSLSAAEMARDPALGGRLRGLLTSFVAAIGAMRSAEA